jgi:hypothetical protein
MDGLFDIKHGISIRGKDYGFIGITDSEIDLRVDDMLLFIDSFKGSAGGTFGEEMETCVDFPYETLTLEKFTEFEKKFREKYPTFDGHVYLHDINHFTADESKVLDSMDYESIQDDDDEEDDVEDGDEWKHQ